MTRVESANSAGMVQTLLVKGSPVDMVVHQSCRVKLKKEWIKAIKESSRLALTRT